MIIRSQNKKEIHVLNNIKMIKVFTNSQEFFIEVNSQHTIGTYSTEEKAIKVLDMIQESFVDANDGYGYVRNTVFQMPQNSEV